MTRRWFNASVAKTHGPIAGFRGVRAGIVAAMVSASLVACKQGRGDRCQVDDDCGPGLICNKATNTCQETGGGGDIDATVPAELIDAGSSTPSVPIDAPPAGPK